MKALPSSMRKKKRYIAFQILAPSKISKQEVIRSILREIRNLYGEILVSDFGLWVLEYNEDNKKGYLVCNHNHKGEIIAGLTLITTLERDNASFHVLGVSGTIKGLKRKFLKDGTD